MRLQTVSVFVDDQQRALDFYTGLLGFEVADDVPVGEHRWLTVVSPGARGGTRLLLEPNDNPIVPPFTAALVEQGIPFLQLGVDDLEAEHERLTAAGVRFTLPPTPAGPVVVAVLDDTVGNLLQLVQAVGS
jgi:catechol 2,3-dioxygenase-like lactoylglutathione lyase family enzyme